MALTHRTTTLRQHIALPGNTPATHQYNTLLHTHTYNIATYAHVHTPLHVTRTHTATYAHARMRPIRRVSDAVLALMLARCDAGACVEAGSAGMLVLVTDVRNTITSSHPHAYMITVHYAGKIICEERS
jgi:hypothetical protein